MRDTSGNEASKYITAAEAGRVLGKSPAAFRQLVRRKQIPDQFIIRLEPRPDAKTKRTRILINRVALERWIQMGGHR